MKDSDFSKTVEELSICIDDILKDFGSRKVAFHTALNCLETNEEAGRQFVNDKKIATIDDFREYCKRRQSALRKGVQAARKEARTKWKEYISRHEVDKIKQIAYISAKEWEENISRMNDRNKRIS